MPTHLDRQCLTGIAVGSNYFAAGKPFPLNGFRESGNKRGPQVLFQEIEDGWIMASVPDVPGAVTQGRDMQEARANIKEAAELVLESYRANAAKDAAANAVWERLTVDVPST